MTRLAGLTSILLLALSFLGLGISILLVHLPSTTPDAFAFRRPLVGGVFSIICGLGILAGLHPSKCSTIFHFRRAKQGELDRDLSGTEGDALRLRGHHPDCGNFSSHVVKIGRRVFCAGCVGLILGAVLSLLGTAAYFFLDSSFSRAYWPFWMGCVGVSCGLLQYHLFDWGKSSIHLSVNAYFVFGVFLILAAADQLARSTVINLYIVALGVLWLYTRIMLSKLDHKTLCEACPAEKCEFAYRKSVEEG